MLLLFLLSLLSLLLLDVFDWFASDDSGGMVEDDEELEILDERDSSVEDASKPSRDGFVAS